MCESDHGSVVSVCFGDICMQNGCSGVLTSDFGTRIKVLHRSRSGTGLPITVSFYGDWLQLLLLYLFGKSEESSSVSVCVSELVACLRVCVCVCVCVCILFCHLTY